MMNITDKIISLLSVERLFIIATFQLGQIRSMRVKLPLQSNYKVSLIISASVPKEPKSVHAANILNNWLTKFRFSV